MLPFDIHSSGTRHGRTRPNGRDLPRTASTSSRWAGIPVRCWGSSPRSNRLLKLCVRRIWRGERSTFVAARRLCRAAKTRDRAPQPYRSEMARRMAGAPRASSSRRADLRRSLRRVPWPTGCRDTWNVADAHPQRRDRPEGMAQSAGQGRERCARGYPTATFRRPHARGDGHREGRVGERRGGLAAGRRLGALAAKCETNG